MHAPCIRLEGCHLCFTGKCNFCNKNTDFTNIQNQFWIRENILKKHKDDEQKYRFSLLESNDIFCSNVLCNNQKKRTVKVKFIISTNPNMKQVIENSKS